MTPFRCYKWMPPWMFVDTDATWNTRLIEGGGCTAHELILKGLHFSNSRIKRAIPYTLIARKVFCKKFASHKIMTHGIEPSFFFCFQALNILKAFFADPLLSSLKCLRHESFFFFCIFWAIAVFKIGNNRP